MRHFLCFGILQMSYSLSIIKKTIRASLSLISALPNDGCYSKQRATSYVYLQTFCVRQIPHMRYWVMMPNEACIRMLVALRSKLNSLSNKYFFKYFGYVAQIKSAYRRSGTCAFFICQISFFPLNKIK